MNVKPNQAFRLLCAFKKDGVGVTGLVPTVDLPTSDFTGFTTVNASETAIPGLYATPALTYALPGTFGIRWTVGSGLADESQVYQGFTVGISGVDSPDLSNVTVGGFAGSALNELEDSVGAELEARGVTLETMLRLDQPVSEAISPTLAAAIARIDAKVATLGAEFTVLSPAGSGGTVTVDPLYDYVSADGLAYVATGNAPPIAPGTTVGLYRAGVLLYPGTLAVDGGGVWTITVDLPKAITGANFARSGTYALVLAFQPAGRIVRIRGVKLRT